MFKKLALLIFAAVPAMAHGQALSYVPPAAGAYISSNGTTWSAWGAGGSFGGLSYTPPAIGLYCQASAGAPWTPCVPGGGGGGSGTVTNVSPADSNSSVANQSTTPTISILSAPKLLTARNINGVPFDGTAPITVPAAGTATGDLSGTYPSPNVSGINGQNLAALGAGLYMFSASGVPSKATPAQVQAAGTDNTKNSSAVFQQETSPGGSDVGVPTPTAGNDILAYTGGALKESKNGAAYSPICTADGTNCPTPGTTVALQTNGTNNASQTTLNLITSTTNAAGLTATPSNTSGGAVKFEITGTPTQPTDAAYTVAGNPTGASAARAATTNPVTTTVSTYAASGLFYIGAAAGGTANCLQGTVTGCTGFIQEAAPGVWDFGTTAAGNSLATIRAARIRTNVLTNNDLAGQLTMAGGTISYTFTGTYATAPICVATDTTAIAATRVVTTTTTLTITGTSTDVVSYICVGRT